MDTQDRLIESTQELLWERGFVGTSPKAIQQRSGIGQGSMYHHFQGKTDLCAAAVRRTGDGLRADVERIMSGPGTALERVEAYLRRDRDILRGCRIGRLAQDPEVVATPELRAPVDETLTWVQRRIAQVIAEGQENGELARTVAADQLATMVFAVIQGGYVLARGENSEKPFTDAVDAAMDLLRGLLVEAPGGPVTR